MEKELIKDILNIIDKHYKNGVTDDMTPEKVEAYYALLTTLQELSYIPKTN